VAETVPAEWLLPGSCLFSFVLYNVVKIFLPLNVHPIIFECMVVVIHEWKFSTCVDEPIIAGKCTEQMQGCDIVIPQIN
jgi:hypothetical protein